MKRDKNYILKMLRSQAKEWMLEPRWKMPREEFNWRSYYNYHIEEIIRKISENQTPPITTVTIYLRYMRHYAIMHSNHSDIFKAGEDAALNILDLLQALEEKEAI